MGPRIETERLILRLPEDGDAADIAAQFNDFDVARMTSRIPYPYPRPAADMWILVSRISWPRTCNFVIENDGEFVGTGGIFRRTAGAEWEIGYALGRHAWGRGLGTEAAAALLAYARDELGATRVVAGHYDDNPASGRILEKIGFRYTGAMSKQYAIARLDYANLKDMEWVAA